MVTSIRSGVLTLLHTACGAGILAMPYAFKPFGLVPGVVMIVICGACAMQSLFIQARVARYVAPGKASFSALTRLINPSLSIVFDLAIAVKCFGVGVSYMIVVGDLMPQIMSTWTGNAWLLSRNVQISLIMLFFVAPLSFLKKLNSLRYASMVAISSVAYLCVLVLVHYVAPSNEILKLKGRVSYFFPRQSHDLNMLNTLPIFVFAYTCHHNMFSIINEQKSVRFEHVMKIPLISISLALALYIAIGCAGYLTFGDNIIGNIIMLYPQSVSSTVGRIAIVLLVMLAFPLQCHPARASIHQILQYFTEENATTSTTSVAGPTGLAGPNESSPLILNNSLDINEVIEEEPIYQPKDTPLRGKSFIIITCGILVASYCVAISVSSLAHVLAIVGATGSTSISFILPGLFGYKLIGTEHKADMPLPTRLFKYSGLALFILGLLIMVTCLTAALKLN
ncbi:aspartate/glutamate transporter [Saccharomyces eubayanus]|uniref:aspartate/glutamate transporter n=1 Tax=Saccharomyces eubayanus TaxID=1080349 RepID=UPI0006C71402|nr:AVT6-like protein [Saccharomyces eubayanus]KOH00069.1 AVT6-like protein [Saccharomyces eubayanus]